jgi:HlyD family secretion protein
VTLQVQTSDGTLTVPREAITYTGGQPHVFVYADGRVLRRLVRLGIQTAEAVEVLDGVRENEQVVVEDPSVLTDAMPVQLKTSSSLARVSRRQQ